MTSEIQVAQAMVLRSAIKLYQQTGMRASRMYTPVAMIRTTEKITGKEIKKRDYAGAVAALTEFIDGRLPPPSDQSSSSSS